MEVDAGPGARYVYEPPWAMYALAWSRRLEPRFRLALGSCIEHDVNRIQVIELHEEAKRFELVAEAEHNFPPTKVMWRPDDSPDGTTGKSDFFASTGTTLNLWKVEDRQIKSIKKLANSRAGQPPHCKTDPPDESLLPPLTSFDWTSFSPHKIGISSVDTTCTIWNLEKQKIETQLIAHDKAVHDMAFSQIGSLFASVGADGSVRLFDQRNLEHSTIIHEASPPSPLLRLAWNKINTNHIATIAMDNGGVALIDIRRPSAVAASTEHEESCINAIAWAPHTRNHLLCGTDDGRALIWDVRAPNLKPEAPPVLAHDCDHEVYQVQWPAVQPDYVALGMSRQVEVLQV